MLHLDTGNTAFTLLCASLVMLMTPGLAFFYGGLVGRKNVLAIMMQSFVSMGWTTVLWWAFGFSLCFSGDQKSGTDFFGIIGNLNWVGLRGITLSTPSPNDTIPMLVFCAYQMMFAIITPALITGAFTNRITFKAYMLFLTAWLILVYFPFVHMVWGGGMLAQWGVKDFAGGIVVHNIAGIAALASVLYVGKRKVADRLVRLQCRVRVSRRCDYRGGVYQYRHCGLVRGHRLVARGLASLEETEIPRVADRRSGRPGYDHARSGLRLSSHCRHHRNCGGRRLLLRLRAEEPIAMGRCTRCVGRARNWRWSGCHFARSARIESDEQCRR